MEYYIELEKEEIKGNKEIACALLEAKADFFVDTKIEENENTLKIISIVKNDYTKFNDIINYPLEEKLRYLINISEIFSNLESSNYTYTFDIKNIVFTRDGLPLLLYRGIVNQVYPYERITYEEFIKVYKSIIVSIIDTKADYDKMLSGGTEFYKGNIACEEIIKMSVVEEIVKKLSDMYKIEKEQVKTNYLTIPKKKFNFFKWGFINLTAISVICFSIIGYLTFVKIPRDNNVSNIRLSFINKDYSNVIKTSEKLDSKSFSQEDKYIVAYSVIQSEPLSDKQKEQLSKINVQSNSDYLRYWILIGQAKIDEAIDVASFLDDPQLLMYGLTKKIDEVQRDPNMSSEKRTEQLNNYKSKLEELKKTYLPTEENQNNKNENNNK